MKREKEYIALIDIGVEQLIYAYIMKESYDTQPLYHLVAMP